MFCTPHDCSGVTHHADMRSVTGMTWFKQSALFVCWKNKEQRESVCVWEWIRRTTESKDDTVPNTEQFACIYSYRNDLLSLCPLHKNRCIRRLGSESYCERQQRREGGVSAVIGCSSFLARRRHNQIFITLDIQPMSDQCRRAVLELLDQVFAQFTNTDGPPSDPGLFLGDLQKLSAMARSQLKSCSGNLA